jgi:hypothetical protein
MSSNDDDPFRSVESEDLDDLLGMTSPESQDLQDLLRTTTESHDLNELLAPSFSMRSEAGTTTNTTPTAATMTTRLEQQHQQQQQQRQQWNAQPRTVPEDSAIGGGSSGSGDNDDDDDSDDGFLSESLASFVRQVETTLSVEHEGFLHTTADHHTAAATTVLDLPESPLPPRKVRNTGNRSNILNINSINGAHRQEQDDNNDHHDDDHVDCSPPTLVDENDDDGNRCEPQLHSQNLLNSPAATAGGLLSEEEEALRRAELAVLKRYDDNNNHNNNNNNNNKNSTCYKGDEQEDTEILFHSPDLATPPPNPHYNLTALTEAKRLAMQGQAEEDDEQQQHQQGANDDNVAMVVVSTPLAASLESAAASPGNYSAAADGVVVATDNDVLMEMAESPQRLARSVEDGSADQTSAIQNNDGRAMGETYPNASTVKNRSSPTGASFPDTLAFQRNQMGDVTSDERHSSAADARKQSNKPPLLTVDTSSSVLDGTVRAPPTTLTPPRSSLARSSSRSGSSSGSVVSEVSYVGEVDEAQYDEEVKRKTPKDGGSGPIPTSTKGASPAQKSTAAALTSPLPAFEKASSPHSVKTPTTNSSPSQQGSFSKRQPSPALAAARAAARGAVTTLKNSVTGMVPKKVASVAPSPRPAPSPPRTTATAAKETARPRPKPAPVQSPKRSPTAPIVSANSRLLQETATSAAHMKKGHGAQHLEPEPHTSPRSRVSRETKSSPTAPVLSASSRLLQETAASASSHLKNVHEQHVEEQTSPRTRTREKLRQRLQQQKEKPPSEKNKSSFSAEEAIQRARERSRLRHLEMQKTAKEDELRHSRAAAAARVKLSRPVTTVPQGPRLSTTARFPDRKPLPGPGAKTVGRRELTVAKSPNFATNARHGAKKLGKVMDTSTALAQSTDILRKGLRSDEHSGGSRSSNSRRGPTIPHSPKFATTERHGRKTVAVHAAPPLALSADVLSKGLRESKPGPELSKKREYALTVPRSPNFQYVKKREAPKSRADEEKEIMDYYKAHPFKAQPVMMNDPIKPSGHQKPPRVITVPAPFHLHTDDRAFLHKRTDESNPSENASKRTRQFQARPMPNFSRPALKPTLASIATSKKPPTNPRPFRLSTGTRAIDSKRSSSPVESKPIAFKARPLPKTTYAPSPTRVSSSVSSAEKYSHITPPHLETAVRSEIRQASNEVFNMHAEEFLKKKEIEAKIRQQKIQIEEMVKLKDEQSAELQTQLNGVDDDQACITQFRARPYHASPPPTMKPRSGRKPTTPEPFQLSTTVTKHHKHEEEERIRAEQEKEKLERKANFKARPVPQTTYKYNPVSPNATGVPLHIANANRQMAEEEKRRADEERRKFKARPLPMTTYTPKPILSPTARPPPSEVTIPQPIFSPELALKQRAHESMAMDAYAAEQDRLQTESAGIGVSGNEGEQQLGA